MVAAYLERTRHLLFTGGIARESAIRTALPTQVATTAAETSHALRSSVPVWSRLTARRSFTPPGVSLEGEDTTKTRDSCDRCRTGGHHPYLTRI